MVASPSTPKRSRKRPIDEPGSNISKQSRKQSTDQPGPSASKQSRKQSTDQPGPGITDKDWQRLIDEVNSDAFEDWKELFDIAGLNTPSQVSDSIDQSSPSTFDKYQQQPADQPSPSTFNQDQQHLMDATGLNISDQDQQQSESANTSSNQVTGLSKKDRITFDGLKQRLVESKELRNKKHKKYCDYEAIGLKQQLALERGEEISGLEYDPKIQKISKQEYEKSCIKVYNFRQQLKKFMKKHGLEFQEPN
ncbi:hypothetical protein QVD99_003338 [Batrachochytrium dendrobatidis]|nr:hypothetical protein QVD99_003338 [Batrachochytrium dendrobatidis]